MHTNLNCVIIFEKRFAFGLKFVPIIVITVKRKQNHDRRKSVMLQPDDLSETAMLAPLYIHHLCWGLHEENRSHGCNLNQQVSLQPQGQCKCIFQHRGVL